MELIDKQSAKCKTQSTEHPEKLRNGAGRAPRGAPQRGRQNSDSKGKCTPDSMNEHGGNIYKTARALGIPEDRIVDFSASINPLGISENVRKVIKRELNGLVHYPDPDTLELRKKIAVHHGIGENTIICGNGSTELIYLVPRVLKPRNVLITAPTFSEYERACLLNYELRITNYELKEESRFSIDPDKFIDHMQGCDIAFLCNPNNPTGGLLSRHEVLEIAGAANKAKCYLVVDEAFIDFRAEESVITDVKDNHYLIVLRSMTKFYALTGLRIGYGIFQQELIQKVKELKEPWTVNNLAQKASVTALEDSNYADETHRLMKMEKAYMEKCFSEMNITYYPSAVNYYLLKVRDASRKVTALRQKGILVRDCSNFKELDSSFIRVAVKSHKHNEVLIREMGELCRA
jgi:threonine-phosphate decarboxylase